MASKEKQQRFHFYKRQQERMPDKVHSGDIVKEIKIQNGVVVRKQSHRVTLWAIFVADDFYIFPYDKNTQQVVSVLPSMSEYYPMMRRAFFRNVKVVKSDWCEMCGEQIERANSVECKCCIQQICKVCIDNHYRACVIAGNWEKIIFPGRPLNCDY